MGNCQKKSFSRYYASTLSLIRKRQEGICKTNINSIHDPQIQNIFQNKLKEINDFKNNLILTRTKNNIYAKGKEITRKKEYKNGNNRYITKINGYEEKDKITEEIKTFYKDLYSSQNIPQDKINTYLESFKPRTLTEIQKNNIGEYVLEEEVLTAINELNENNSPRNDCISAEFYKTLN